MTYILGISAYYHDSSASLIKDGEILGAIQEERLSRIKHDSSFPSKSINYLMNENNLKLHEINDIVFYEKPFLKFERLLESYVALAPRGFKSFCASMPIWLREKLFQKNNIFSALKKIDPEFSDINKIKFSEHHLSHAASAFFPSPFEESLIITLDGVGEWATTTIGFGQKNNIDILKEINFPHSLGLIYSAFTYYLGFKVNSGEYKVMGLAPYGEPKYKDIILNNLIDIKDDGSFRIDMRYFDFATGLKMINKKFENLFGEKTRDPDKEELTQFHMDIASSIQSTIEDVIIKITKYMSRTLKYKNLCLSGGVALNCVANGKIHKEKIFENIWVQPAAGDAGGSLGAALAYWHMHYKKPRSEYVDQMKGSLLGPNFDNNLIIKKLEKLNISYLKKNSEEINEIISEDLKNGKTVAWFQGRMEFGPRALGNRSILADPRVENMQKNLNLKVKFRESFRPFAPAIIFEKVSEYFNLNVESPYMLLVSNVNEKQKVKSTNSDEFFGIEKLNLKRSKISAVTHVDYSARVQTVKKETNSRFYSLIQKFYEKTGCPVLVNTSFNVRGEPIVCTPEDAINCFMSTNLDVLVLENCLIYKSDQNIKDWKDERKVFDRD